MFILILCPRRKNFEMMCRTFFAPLDAILPLMKKILDTPPKIYWIAFELEKKRNSLRQLIWRYHICFNDHWMYIISIILLKCNKLLYTTIYLLSLKSLRLKFWFDSNFFSQWIIVRYIKKILHHRKTHFLKKKFA